VGIVLALPFLHFPLVALELALNDNILGSAAKGVSIEFFNIGLFDLIDLPTRRGLWRLAVRAQPKEYKLVGTCFGRGQGSGLGIEVRAGGARKICDEILEYLFQSLSALFALYQT
jgi:hypothetical protein